MADEPLGLRHRTLFQVAEPCEQQRKPRKWLSTTSRLMLRGWRNSSTGASWGADGIGLGVDLHAVARRMSRLCSAPEGPAGLAQATFTRGWSLSLTGRPPMRCVLGATRYHPDKVDDVRPENACRTVWNGGRPTCRPGSFNGRRTPARNSGRSSETLNARRRSLR